MLQAHETLSGKALWWVQTWCGEQPGGEKSGEVMGGEVRAEGDLLRSQCHSPRLLLLRGFRELQRVPGGWQSQAAIWPRFHTNVSGKLPKQISEERDLNYIVVIYFPILN